MVRVLLGLKQPMMMSLRGTPGKIYTVCDGRGVEVKGYKERRQAPKKGDTLVTTLDINIQRICEQKAADGICMKTLQTV